jgi:hypothetical protein
VPPPESVSQNEPRGSRAAPKSPRCNAQQVLRGQIFDFLDCNEVVRFERADAMANRLMELAKANHARLVGA